jgi:hypothetical protein
LAVPRDSHVVRYRVPVRYGTSHSTKEGDGSLYSCTGSLATVTSCIDDSVRIVTKSPKVGPLLIFSISLGSTNHEFAFNFQIVLYGDRSRVARGRMMPPVEDAAMSPSPPSSPNRIHHLQYLQLQVPGVGVVDPNLGYFEPVESVPIGSGQNPVGIEKKSELVPD